MTGAFGLLGLAAAASDYPSSAYQKVFAPCALARPRGRARARARGRDYRYASLLNNAVARKARRAFYHAECNDCRAGIARSA